jgi:hypothetical protein
MKSSAKYIALLALTILLSACSNQKPTETKTSITYGKPQNQAARKGYYLPTSKLSGQWTVQDVLQTYGENAKNKLNYYFAKAKVPYPPREFTLIALKQEKKMELWARVSGGFRFIRDYYILAASGTEGPKLRQGDKQVPEGIYRISELNPNSHYHLSMKLNYPNDFDYFQAGLEGRTDLGSDIFIHGKDASIGCLAMGDDAISELFVLTALVGTENVKVVIAPHDPRKYPLRADPVDFPEWTAELYALITREIEPFSPNIKSAKTRH